MTQPRRPGREAGMQELLSDEIGRLVMRADRIMRHEVEAVVSRVKGPNTVPPSHTRPSRKTETMS